MDHPEDAGLQAADRGRKALFQRAESDRDVRR